MKIVIVGAGVAGLAIGWNLARAGASVEIVERGLAGYGATWASAGMLAPGAELGTEDSAVARFAHEARGAWPTFARELESASGIDIGFREDGALIVAEDAARARALKSLATKTGDVWLEGAALTAREPLLSNELHGAAFVAGDAQVDNRALGVALTKALQNLGVTVRENCAVHSVAMEGERVLGLITAQGTIAADAVLLASGAWMNLISGLPPNVLPPVKPVKGQMAALVPPDGTMLPKALVWGDGVYLVPRRDRLIVGATVEDAGFDTSVVQGACDTLLAAARRIVPASAHWQIAEMWAGLRPRTADDAPVLGQSAIAGLYVAGGQFRNGILFAPLIANSMSRLVLGQSGGPDIGAFDPKRFLR